MTQLLVPSGIVNWFDQSLLDRGKLDVTLRWRGDKSLSIGSLWPARMLFRFKPDPPPNFIAKTNAERLTRLVAKAFTRAGWLRPQLDPALIPRLVELRVLGTRIEFIVDTNAMVEGICHWLVDLFADCCDLVVTGVTLRELQDQREIAEFAARLDDRNKNGKRLGARQVYLAANRFRESTGYKRVLWRELELDDTALLLSRGSGGGKRSESDTLLLRTVRRSIHDRVNRLERFFVTGDTAQARRANSELPVGNVIAAQVKDLTSGQVYFPCAWWPGSDQGRRVPRHPAKLIWELLAIADELELRGEDGSTWTFRAFANPMWPSDYSEPWVIVTEPDALTAKDDRDEGEIGRLTNEGAALPASASIREGRTRLAGEALSVIWAPPARDAGVLDKNLRLSANTILDLLEVLASDDQDSIVLPKVEGNSSERRYHTKMLLEGLNLAEVDQESLRAKPLAQRAVLARAWTKGDRDGIFDVLRAWKPLNECAVLKRPPTRAERTQQTARALASLLGQGMHFEGTWLPGGLRPTAAQVRNALLQGVPQVAPRAIPMYDLLVDVFLRRLAVHPTRAMAAWDRMKELGVFDGFEPRTGGSSSGRHTLDVAEFSPSGWTTARIDLEAYRGYRDLNYRGISSE